MDAIDMYYNLCDNPMDGHELEECIRTSSMSVRASAL